MQEPLEVGQMIAKIGIFYWTPALARSRVALQSGIPRYSNFDDFGPTFEGYF